MIPAEFLAGHALAEQVYARMLEVIRACGQVTVKATRSQIAFRRRRGFAYLWLPGQYLTRPGADVVLSIVLGRRDDSPRWKEVVKPSARHWMHHLEVRRLEEIDLQVETWLSEAAQRAG